MLYRRSQSQGARVCPDPGSARRLGGLATLCAVSAARAASEWDDLRPISEPATPPPGSPTSGQDPGSLFSQGLFLELGFSFMVGLAVGYALKIAFKIALVAIGLILLGVFGLQYAGMVHVDWSAIELRYDSWADWLAINGRLLMDFIGRNLSSAASFVAGLGLGLKL
jgi:uncharacterized membrane protein (Fun14 family)